MVKTYLKYQLRDVIGQITGKQSRGVPSRDGRFLYTGCNEYILVVDLKSGQVIHKIKYDGDSKSQVTCIQVDHSDSTLVAGYNDGTMVLFDVKDSYTQVKRFSLHKSAVTCLEFNKTSNLLASGSKDTNIFIWDVIGETVLYRLSGHKDGITKLVFHDINTDGLEDTQIQALISSAKDNTIKLWNIKNQETMQTIADLIHKVTDFIIHDNILIVGSFDVKLRLYSFSVPKKSSANNQIYFALKGNLNRQSSAKITSLNLSNDGKIISVLSNDNTIEFIKILNEKELRNRIIKTESDKSKKNEKREMLVQKDKFKELVEKSDSLVQNAEFHYPLKFYSLFKFIGESKIGSFAFFKQHSNLISTSKNIWKFVICMANNSIEIYELNSTLIESNIFTKNNFTIEEKKANQENLSVEKIAILENEGHRDILRYITFSERENMFLTTSNDSIRLWNYSSLNLIKGLKLDSIISAKFILNDKYIVLGSKKGNLYIIHTASFEVVQKIEKAHSGEIWNVFPLFSSYNDKKYKILTCSSDKTIKYWNLNTKNTEILTEYKTIETLDQLTYCMVSPDGSFLIYSQLDNSIKVVYEDTNKNYLTLYGHKLPVLSFDVSSDGVLLVSGAADKNVKLWGMDFGDCHKSLFAHQDSVTTVKFVNKTHYFFSCSKDNVVRYWDGDTFDLIMEISDFFGNVWSLDINNSGTALVAVSADYSIRVYEISKEQVVPDWEKEKKLDRFIEEDLQKELDANKANVNPYNKEIDKIVPIKKSMDNIGFAEDLMDALDHAEKFKNDVYQYEIATEEYKKSLGLVKTKNYREIKAYNLEEPELPIASPFLLGKNIFDYILYKLKSIRHTDLEGALNNLPYSYVQTLIFYLEYYIRNNIEIELMARSILFLTVLFESQLSNDKTLIQYFQSIRTHLKKNLSLSKDLISFNIQSVDFIIRSYFTQQKSMEDYKNSYELNKLI